MPSSNYCSDQPSDPFAITAEPDISGLGVLVGFLSTAYIILAIIIVYYVVGYDPTLNPFRTTEQDTLIWARPNPFDQLVLKVARRILCIDPLQWQTYRKDGRLAAAFDKRLSALHWKMIVYLGWFSCITNLSALTFLRSYLIRNPFERVWRLGSTFVLLIGLTVALIPTGHFFWVSGYLENSLDAAPSAYAICYFNTDFKQTYSGSYAGKNAMILSILLLVFSYMVKLFKVHRGFGYHRLKTSSVSAFTVGKCLKSAAVFQRLIGSTSFLERSASNMMVAAHFVVCIWIDIYSSMASDIFWLTVSLAWGTLRIAELRAVLKDASFFTHEDDSGWSFGQILPVLLIAGPILILVRAGREAFVPVHPENLIFDKRYLLDSHGHIQESIVETSNSNAVEVAITPILILSAAAVVLEHDGEPHTREPGTSTEANALHSGDQETCWILNPSQFTEYYETSQWMCWAPVV
ncbi:hypothetical protein K449DRAFT_419347 [Hypoxylon sp. EC38]|nr:hypothetical protein K449DRAFT_419347 [Hypoxylon sp. EC38]